MNDQYTTALEERIYAKFFFQTTSFLYIYVVEVLPELDDMRSSLSGIHIMQCHQI